jgi:hypothetical protein
VKAESARDLAQDALLWMTGQPEVLERFLGATGAGPESLRAGLADPEFLGFVLDFLLGDESLLLAFAASAGIDPALPARARAALPGGNLPNWT